MELSRTQGSRENLGVKWERLASASMSEKVTFLFPNHSFGAVVGLLSVVLQGISGTVLTTCIWALLIIAYRIFKFKEADKRQRSVVPDANFLRSDR